MITSLKSARDAFRADSRSASYTQHYGADAFMQWLNVTLPTLVKEACAEVDREDRRFTKAELRGLATLYVVSKPYGYTFLPDAARPRANAESIAAWVTSLDGYGHMAALPVYRDRLPVEYGIATPDYWRPLAAKHAAKPAEAAAPAL